jgi:hypothetical protein
MQMYIEPWYTVQSLGLDPVLIRVVMPSFRDAIGELGVLQPEQLAPGAVAQR